MSERNTIHFVHEDSRMRAHGARVAYALGHHAEVYSGMAELIAGHPAEGIIFAQDRSDEGGKARSPARMLEELGVAGIWLPLILISEQPERERVIEAVKAGVIDYLPLPLDAVPLRKMWDRLAGEATTFAEGRRRMIEARERINHLSQREREVLDKLADGNSNKAIARALAISPRTVEIHRANMMGKLGANHAAEAVRIRIEARLDELENSLADNGN
ncbi:MAG TPA: LuxR C-terminal-related transcriptional regulator [Alteraurantiacibacter sp.]|jgi:FixJ family two-component response regulator